MASFEPDIAIQFQLYDGLTGFTHDAQIVNHLAESVTPNKDGSVWTVKLKPGLTWHNGKPVTADDVVYSFDRIVNPKAPMTGAASLTGLKVGGTRKVDKLTVQFHLNPANVVLPEGLAFRGNMLVPQGFDVGLKAHKPIGCGPFKLTSFMPGNQFTFAPFDEFWGGRPYVDELTIIEFADDTARVNALLGRHRGCHLGAAVQPRPRRSRRPRASRCSTPRPAPGGPSRCASTSSLQRRARAAGVPPDRRPSGDDHAGLRRLRRASATTCTRRFDPGYPHSLPQRHQDLAQAKSLLKAAGYDNNLTVTARPPRPAPSAATAWRRPRSSPSRPRVPASPSTSTRSTPASSTASST